MSKKMLIDATHPEETRVAVVSGNRLEEYDYETLVRKQLKSNIYLVKVTRVEPSLQAAFVDFGGNRHGFLPFPEIHPDYYRIPIADREALIAEERALAAEQAAREEAEDAAELAAAGESLEDLEDEDEGEEDDDAAEIDDLGGNVEEVAYAAPEEASAEETAGEEETGDDDAEQGDAAPASYDAPVLADDNGGEGDDGDDEPENVGGDNVDAPVFRSSIKRKYKIQEVIKRNQIMLIQISKEERGNKGAAVTTYISLPGRYCVLMPNSPRGGGVSRKVSNVKDRQRLKKILHDLNVPEGMSVILRTAGVSRTKAEIKRDLEYLLRLWDQIRELTLRSTAPALIYEEGNLIKRAIRDLYRRDISEVVVSGEEGFKTARDFMNTLMPSHVDKVQKYDDTGTPLFIRHQVEKQIDEIHNPTVHLKSGGYIVINPTEAMVSIDVNSGKATKGRHIEETALKTNLEAADEIARQLRLRDQGGLVVIDFIDMEDRRGNRQVERRLRDAMQGDRARIQLGRISPFGLLELSRQRLNPSLVETNFEVCRHCNGTGMTRTVETSAVMVLRGIEEECMKGRATDVRVGVPVEVALYIFNHKRSMLAAIERRHGVHVYIHADENLIKPAFTIEGVKAVAGPRIPKNAPVQTVDMSDLPELSPEDISDDSTVADDERYDSGDEQPGDDRREGRGDRGERRGRRGGRDRRRGGRDRDRDRGGNRDRVYAENGDTHDEGFIEAEGDAGEARAERQDGDRGNRPDGERRRRRRRGGRNRNRDRGGDMAAVDGTGDQPAVPSDYVPTKGVMIQEAPARNTDNASVPESASEAAGGGKTGWWKRLTE